MSDISLPGPPSASDAGLAPPDMPDVDMGKLGRTPTLFVDSTRLQHTLGWQRSAGGDGPCVTVCRLNGMSVKVIERFPLTEAGWALAWTSLVNRDAVSAEALLEILAAKAAAREAAASGGAVLAPPPPPRFPSSAVTRRNILNQIAKGNEKYARPFDRGKVAQVSFVGTESWSDYGNVVLQMAILDTLLSIEQKLGTLLRADEDDTPG